MYLVRFDWDDKNRIKIEAHGVSTNEYEQAPDAARSGTENRRAGAPEDRGRQDGSRESVDSDLHNSTRQSAADHGIRIEKDESKVATKTLKKKAAPPKPAKVVALKVPDFRSESEEADWWYAHRDLVEDLLDKHGRRAGNGFDLEVELVKPSTKAISIRLAEPDIQRAKALAARKGVGYQTYIRSVLHEALLSRCT